MVHASREVGVIMRRPSTPIIMASISVAITIALLVGWTLVLVQNLEMTEAVAQNTTILVLGIISFLMIIGVLVVNCVFLVRRIREVNRQYSFIDSVTHELKSPLASLKLSVETLGREGLREQQKQEVRRMMVADIGRLHVFINDILTASRVNHHARRQAWEVVDLMESLRLSFAEIAGRHEVDKDVLVLTGPEHVWVESDATALNTIFTNLFDNAVKYSRQDDQSVPGISTTVRLFNGRVEVCIADEGIGIPVEHRRAILQRFYRVPSESVRKRYGTGLGLFVVAELVRGLKGKIRFEENPEGAGTCVVVRLRKGNPGPSDEVRK
jgi:signal transduction histidine kinase